jgi:PHP family Zn ribbon phosphoesterase
LELLLSIDEKIFLIPCHVWTPWFSLYGSRSGFDSIEEAFGNYSKYICAVETGLSSDPIMNWQIKELENRSIVSFSDAHSGQKLGREATVFIPNNNFSGRFNYFDIIAAFKQEKDGHLKIGYTIEFFPEEGKYHWSGHRACQIRYNPKDIKEKGEICPVCGKPLTIGVENRVLALAQKILTNNDLVFLKNKYDVTFVYDPEKKRPPFVSLVPLLEILQEINQSPTKAEKEYEKLVGNLGSEFEILLKRSYDEIEKIGGEKLRLAIEIVRGRKVFVDPGYDGVFGVVKIFKNENEQEKNLINQEKLF